MAAVRGNGRRDSLVEMARLMLLVLLVLLKVLLKVLLVLLVLLVVLVVLVALVALVLVLLVLLLLALALIALLKFVRRGGAGNGRGGEVLATVLFTVHHSSRCIVCPISRREEGGSICLLHNQHLPSLFHKRCCLSLAHGSMCSQPCRTAASSALTYPC
jgi:hypothetical protein